MQKSDIRILIIEDDPSLGKALEEGFKRSGYQAQLAANYPQAISSAKIMDFHGIVADCMLPQKSGVDIAAEIIAESVHNPVVVLTSGIFKDKAFIHDAQVKTKSKAFLTKPFDIEELISHFDKAFSHLIEDSKEPLFQLMAKEQYSPRDRVIAINKTEYAHGYDLPFVYSLLLDNKIIGDLEIQYDEALPTTIIGFHKGRIDKVQFPDTESYFGVLLIEKGFTTPAELEEGLNLKSNKPIGERLVESASLSPHAIEIIQHEQMVIRLSKTIQDASVKISFTDKTKPEPKIFVDNYLLTQLLSDWICSKLPMDWLHSYYTPWLENPILKGPESSKINLLKSLPVIKKFADNFSQNNWPHSLETILAENPNVEDDYLRAIHFFALQRIIVFGSKANSSDNFKIKLSRLTKIANSYEEKNHFEILGLSAKAKSSEIHRAYHELAKALHPDKIHKDSPAELQNLSQKIFSKITDAYQTLSDETKRKTYRKTLELGHTEDILKAETSFEEGMRHLKSNRFRDARKVFEHTLTLKGHRSDTLVYLIWAVTKEKRNRINHEELAEKINSLLNRVPHEERHSAHYFFVKGMFYDLSGDTEKAYKHHKHCLTMDPYFLDAKRELEFINDNQNRKKANTLTGELSTVVAKIFGKKSS